MRRKIIYRKILILIFVISLGSILFLAYYNLDSSIPNNIHIRLNQKESFDFKAPIEANLEGENIDVISIKQGKIDSNKINFNFDSPFTIESSKVGNYQINLKLFGFIHYKTIDVDVINNIKVYPNGMPIGIVIQTDGILVLGTSAITCEDGLNYEPALNILKSGDYIIAVNDKKVSGKEDLINTIQDNGENKLTLKVRRNQSQINLTLKSVKSVDGDYKIGAWIRDDTQGIGTLTYVNEKGQFGALGHGITDIDTNTLIDIKKGNIFYADIAEIVKGKNGAPGEIVGIINATEKNKIGIITKNTNQGIFGNTNDSYQYQGSRNAILIGLKQEIKIGKATILCHVEDEVKEYEVKIIKVDLNNKNKSKGIILEITDKKLLEKTNGIVQGMSGSPILQNGKLIGAVTHVFIQDSTKGYGTFIENMLKSAE